ncbi:MAG: hypothetical protein RR672_04250 [Raoultibacter sp.]
MGDVVQHLSTVEILAYVCTYIGGVLMNYIVKTKREGLDWKQYWTLNPVTSLAAVLVSTGMCITLLLQGETNHLTYFSIAFMAENLINTQTTKNEQKSDQS